MNNQKAKAEKKVFVIMPFTMTDLRKKEQLDDFFTDNLKKRIEREADLNNKYIVWRSGTTFNITDQIIRDLYKADIVIADLSGEYPNPNVMYELGVRLTISDNPVILIRENNPNNKQVFDVRNYSIYTYDLKDYKTLENHIIHKLRLFETREEIYESPVRNVLRDADIQCLSALDQRKKMQRFCSRVQGAWWQRISEEDDKGPKISISFVEFEADEVTNEVSIRGHTFDKKGKPLGSWWSVAVTIEEKESTIQYFWRADLSEKHPGAESKGFGHFRFAKSTGVFKSGEGKFMNTRISGLPISWWKYVRLRRITDERHIQRMIDGDDQEKKELVMKILKAWGGQKRRKFL